MLVITKQVDLQIKCKIIKPFYSQKNDKCTLFYLDHLPVIYLIFYKVQIVQVVHNYLHIDIFYQALDQIKHIFSLTLQNYVYNWLLFFQSLVYQWFSLFGISAWWKRFCRVCGPGSKKKKLFKPKKKFQTFSRVK